MLPVLRIAVGAPIAALLLAAFVVALLVEWLRDLASLRPHSEKFP